GHPLLFPTGGTRPAAQTAPFHLPETQSGLCPCISRTWRAGRFSHAPKNSSQASVKRFSCSVTMPFTALNSCAGKPLFDAKATGYNQNLANIAAFFYTWIWRGSLLSLE